MGRRHTGLDAFAWWVLFEEWELPRLSHVSRLGSDLGFSAYCLSFEILLYLELYLVEIIYVVGFILCWGHDTYLDMYLIPLWLYVEWLFSCMTMLAIICRRDDYFLCIYLNCMIYCLIRNRALHHSPHILPFSSSQHQLGIRFGQCSQLGPGLHGQFYS